MSLHPFIHHASKELTTVAFAFPIPADCRLSENDNPFLISHVENEINKADSMAEATFFISRQWYYRSYVDISATNCCSGMWSNFRVSSQQVRISLHFVSLVRKTYRVSRGNCRWFKKGAIIRLKYSSDYHGAEENLWFVVAYAQIQSFHIHENLSDATQTVISSDVQQIFCTFTLATIAPIKSEIAGFRLFVVAIVYAYQYANRLFSTKLTSISFK